jgi:hypothetical protein
MPYAGTNLAEDGVANSKVVLKKVGIVTNSFPGGRTISTAFS